jgi:hypothetical protein
MRGRRAEDIINVVAIIALSLTLLVIAIAAVINF